MDIHSLQKWMTTLGGEWESEKEERRKNEWKENGVKGRGFTLVEVMVVLVIVSILIGLAVPMFSLFSRRRKLENAGRLFQSAVNTARSYAVTRQKRFKLVFAQSALKIYNTETGKYQERFPIPVGVEYYIEFKGDRATGFDDSAESPESPSPTAVNNYSLEFRVDGSINFGQYTSVSYSEYAQDRKADIVIHQKGETARCFIDLEPASGKANWKFVEKK
ncbi:MAG: prepilin-type N-terminal cleavage/methylation domain-containing protein [Planctomycetota bacterium]|nr:prepilin-type N-terminal cleavage/methylation domain-containing protein [Planctomycetota bacterium]